MADDGSPRMTAPARVLIVEDDPNLSGLLGAALKMEGWDIDVASDAIQAEQAVEEFRPDVAILDVHLGPGPDGLALARRIRNRGDLPFLFLTDRVTIEDRLAGFDSGADDYLAKPFNLAELVARLRVILARRGLSRSHVLEIGGLEIDQSGRRVLVHGELVELTRMEFDLLRTLASPPGRVVTKSQLLSEVWGFETYDENLLHVNVSTLRRKLGGCGALVHTVRGVGYVLREA
ncbi:MAG: response regulator transcription factor [Actinobacteria bacterium]|nr:response regulator transcription factor [Actinomycetota bacterium]